MMEAHDALPPASSRKRLRGNRARGSPSPPPSAFADTNELSWTQVVDHVEFMSDATRIPILLDGDTGYGNFNNMRRLGEETGATRGGSRLHRRQTFPQD